MGTQSKLKGKLYWERQVLLYNTEQELEQDLEALKNVQNIYLEEQELNLDSEHIYRVDLDLYLDDDAHLKTKIKNLNLHGILYMERRQYKYKTIEDVENDKKIFTQKEKEMDWEIFDEWETENLYPGYIYSIGINKPGGNRKKYINY